MIDDRRGVGMVQHHPEIMYIARRVDIEGVRPEE
jgi:hypothetical protein